jgi:hypothetical protein
METVELIRQASLESQSSQITCVESPLETACDMKFYPMSARVDELPPLPRSLPRHRSLYSRKAVDELDTMPRLAPNPSAPTEKEHLEHVAFCRIVLTPAQVLDMQGQSLFRVCFFNLLTNK